MKKGSNALRLLAPVATLAFALSLAACAPQQTTGLSNTGDDESADEPAVVQMEWSLDSDCSMCHDGETASMADAACPASTHEAQGATCAMCHNDEAALTEAHVSAEADSATPSHLSSSDVSQEACLTCHNMDDLAAVTADLDVLTDTQGTTVNPHALPDNADHAAEATCSSCHKMHESDGDPQRDARRLCNDCHHEGVYECYTCHS